MGIPLSEATLRLVDGKNYAVLATVNPDGRMVVEKATGYAA